MGEKVPNSHHAFLIPLSAPCCQRLQRNHDPFRRHPQCCPFFQLRGSRRLGQPRRRRFAKCRYPVPKRHLNSGATLAPGDNVGTLTTGSTTLIGSYVCEIDGAAADRLSCTGDLTISSSATLVFSILNAPTLYSYVIASWGGVLSGTFSNVTGKPVGYDLVYDSGLKQIRLDYINTWTGSVNSNWDTVTANWINLGTLVNYGMLYLANENLLGTNVNALTAATGAYLYDNGAPLTIANHKITVVGSLSFAPNSSTGDMIITGGKIRLFLSFPKLARLPPPPRQITHKLKGEMHAIA